MIIVSSHLWGQILWWMQRRRARGWGWCRRAMFRLHKQSPRDAAVLIIVWASHDHIVTWCGRLAPLLRSLTLEASQLGIYAQPSTYLLSPPQRWLSRRSRGQQPETSPTFLQHLLATAALSTQGQCSNFISPQERKSYLTLSLCDSLGRNLGQFTTVLSSNI